MLCVVLCSSQYNVCCNLKILYLSASMLLLWGLSGRFPKLHCLLSGISFCHHMKLSELPAATHRMSAEFLKCLNDSRIPYGTDKDVLRDCSVLRWYHDFGGRKHYIPLIQKCWEWKEVCLSVSSLQLGWFLTISLSTAGEWGVDAALPAPFSCEQLQWWLLSSQVKKHFLKKYMHKLCSYIKVLL